MERFQIESGNHRVEWAVSSTGDLPTKVSMVQNGKQVPLKKGERLRIQMVGGTRIPLMNGYFEVVIPAKLLEANPTEIRLSWIDSYRG